MAIRVIERKHIDEKAWDNCVGKAANGTISGLTWFLDIVCPQWVGVSDSCYSFVLPVPLVRKGGVKMIVQPFLCQQLACYSQRNLTANEMRRLRAVLNAYFFFSYSCDSNTASLDLFERKWHPQPNYELCLQAPYDILIASYSKNHKRNLRKAYKAHLFCSQVHTSSSIFNFLRKYSKYEYSSGEWNKLKQVIEVSEAHRCAMIYGTYNDKGELLGLTIFINYQSRILYLCSATSPEGYQKQCQTYAFDKLIQKFANTFCTLDFEGSRIDSIARFFKGFGAGRCDYYIYTSTKMKCLERFNRVWRK